tara:strand:- start:849 stop:1100 length:252 start_codon:yes stop_codon:yes gene_type:complete
MTELEKPVVRKSRLSVRAAKDRKVVVSLEALDTISIRPIGTRKSNAYSMTFEDFFWYCARAKAETVKKEKRAARKTKRKRSKK